MRRSLILALAIPFLASCETTNYRVRRGRWRRPSFTAQYPTYQGPPRIQLSAEEIDARLAEYKACQARREAELPESAKSVNVNDFEALVRSLDVCYRKGAVDQAEKLLAEHRAKVQPVRVVNFDDPEVLDLVDLEIEYRKRTLGGSLFVKVRRRPNFKGLLAVAFPPGTFARPYIAPTDEQLYGDWPRAEKGNVAGTPREQDLVCLGARIAWLDPEVEEVEVRFPVCCGRFNKGEPKHLERYFLVRFPRGEPMDRLCIELCATDFTLLDHGAAQMAVWILRDKLSFEDFDAKQRSVGPSLTFETGELVRSDDGANAVDTFLNAGIDPRQLPFYDVPDYARAGEPAPAPAPTQEGE